MVLKKYFRHFFTTHIIISGFGKFYLIQLCKDYILSTKAGSKMIEFKSLDT